MSYSTKLIDGRIQCEVCPRECRLNDGQRGLCFVRMRQSEEIVLTTYGRSSGYCIDPIEKKPLNHFYPGSPVLSFGTTGCNLTCKFCQNWDISKSREMDRLMDQADPEKIARVAKKLNCKSVAFTYNDPIIFLEYARDTALACKEQGVKSVAVTAGYMKEKSRIDFFEHIDAANIDLKAFTQEFYKKQCGSSIKPVLDTLMYLKNETQVWFEITTLLIPGLNDSDSELNNMCEWIFENLGPNIPLHFSAFHPDYKMKDIPRTPFSTLTKARSIASQKGLNYVYTGNVHHIKGDTTLCIKCKSKLIVRDWYNILEYNLDEIGMCIECGAQCYGHFDKTPGTWGASRQQVHLASFN